MRKYHLSGNSRNNCYAKSLSKKVIYEQKLILILRLIYLIAQTKKECKNEDSSHQSKLEEFQNFWNKNASICKNKNGIQK